MVRTGLYRGGRPNAVQLDYLHTLGVHTIIDLEINDGIEATGGQIVKVLREDDPDGKWNYEVFVKANGKESGFEVDPNGKFVKQHE